ncbi:mucin-7-like [Adelges cooleyi]|uniref:mucin-7-like n=1 Tax=Adelges cooleyi TaxID=133065 RepID=UPI0021804CF4|nr:mucin-7-like [Adelges cooleyi]
MDFVKIWVIVVFLTCCGRSGNADNVNVPEDNHTVRSRSKKSTEIYLALPPDTEKSGKQNAPPTLIRLDPSMPNKFKGKFPTPIERFIQRIQNYFSVYNPPEYLNELSRPGINNPDNDGDDAFVDDSNNTHVVLPCNGTSTIVIIPVPLESENFAFEQKPVSANVNRLDNDNDNKPASYEQPPSTPLQGYPESSTPKSPCPDAITTTAKPKCQEATTTTTAKPKCPEVTTTTTAKPKCQEATTTTTTTAKPPCSNSLVAEPLGSTVVYFYKKVSPSTPAPTYLPPNPPTPAYYVANTGSPYDGYQHKPKQLPPILRLKQILFPRLYAAFHSDE